MKQSAIKHGLSKEKLKNGSINDEGKDETPMVVIKITNHGTLHHFWSADLANTFSQMPIFI